MNDVEPCIPRNSSNTSTYGKAPGLVRVSTKLSQGLRVPERKDNSN